MENLSNKLLVATPKLNDVRFMQAVVYMYKHGVDGSAGFMINKIINRSLWLELCQKAQVENPVDKDIPIYFGGPVEPQVGFVLHTPEYKIEQTECINNLLSITQGLDIIVDIAQGAGPNKFQVTLGHSGWSPGQLEAEIETLWPRDADAGWFWIKPTDELLFDFPADEKWERAIGSYASNYVEGVLNF